MESTTTSDSLTTWDGGQDSYMYDGNMTDYSTGVITPFYIAIILVVHVPLWVLNVGGNSLVIVAVYYEKKLRQPTYFLIAALAVADIALPLIAYPSSIYAVFVENQYTCSAGSRTYFFFMTYACVTASFFHIMAITLERCIGVVRPLRYRELVNQRRIVWLVVVMWLTSFAVAVMALPFGREDDLDPICREPEPSSLFSFLVFIFCVVGMIFLSFAYLHIYLIAREHWRKMQTEREQAMAFSNDQNGIVDENDNDNDEVIQLKATKTIGIIVVFFVICYLPMAVRYLCEVIKDDLAFDWTTWIFIKRFSETFGLLNGAINPLVYAHRNSLFRHAFKNIIKACFKRLTCSNESKSRKGSLALIFKGRSSISTDAL